MQLVTITLNGQWEETAGQNSLFEHITQCLEQIHTKYGKKLYLLHVEEGRLVIEANVPAFQLDRHAKPFYEKLGHHIANWIIAELEPQLLREYIVNEGYDEAETDEIMKYCDLLLNQQDYTELDPLIEGRWNRKKKLANAVKEHIEMNTWLNIDGLFTFRLRFYTEELRDITHYAIDEYIMEQQYQEFIHLLKYFVLVQESKMPEVHIMYRPGDQVEIWDNKREPIEVSELNGLVMETIDKDIRFEDMVISTLISVAPEKIYIHTRDPDMQIIRTIEQIFEHRTEVCTDCSICQPLLGKKPLDPSTNPVYN